MQPEIAEKLTRKIQALFRNEQINVHHCLQQGLALKEYQVQDRIYQALSIALDILETFSGESDKYCVIDEVEQCLKIIEDSFINGSWKDLAKNKNLPKLMGGIGFLAADMGLPDKAESLFHILALQAPDNAHTWLGIAYARLAAGSAHKALEVIREKVLNIAPGNDLGLAFLALAYDRLNKTEEALAAASAVITANRHESAVSLAREVQRCLGKPAVSNYIAE